MPASFAQAAPEDALFYAPGAAFTKLFPKEVMANMQVNDQHRFWRRAMNQSLSPQVCPHFRVVYRHPVITSFAWALLRSF